MYEPEKVYVQNGGGIDAGIAALLQNANKGNLDPSALMAMMNNGGFGNNGWWWIWIVLLLFFCGGNGFGRNGLGVSSQLNTDAAAGMLLQAINGNKDAIGALAGTFNCDNNSLQAILNQINTRVSQLGCDNSLSVCQQTNSLTNTMNANTISLRDAAAANTGAIVAKLDAMQSQALIDKIETLREKNSTLASQLSNEHLTAAVGQMITLATTPIMAHLNGLQADVDGMKCRLPLTVNVPYPQLSVYNPEVFRAAAMGAYAGDRAYFSTTAASE